VHVMIGLITITPLSQVKLSEVEMAQNAVDVLVLSEQRKMQENGQYYKKLTRSLVGVAE